MLKNTSSSYGSVTRLFHWLVGITILTLIVVGFIMTSMEPSDEKWKFYNIHKSTGVIVLFLVSLRFLWRLINVNVELPYDMPNYQKLAARLMHYLLYVFMFVMPISGILMSRFGGHDINIFNLFTIGAFEKNISVATFFHSTHVISAWILSILIGMHFAAGLYHHFIRKDNVFIRMIKG